MALSSASSVLCAIQTHKKCVISFGVRVHDISRFGNHAIHKGHRIQTVPRQNVRCFSSSFVMCSKGKNNNRNANNIPRKSDHQLTVPLVTELYLDGQPKSHLNNFNQKDNEESDASQFKLDIGKLSSEFMETSAEYEVEEADDSTGQLTAVFGSPDPTIPISSIPCPGCGARLHCQDPAIPGYVPSQRFIVEESILKKSLCQRCIMMRKHNLALNVSVQPEEYTKLIANLRTVEALAIVVVDVMDMTNSIYTELSELIGHDKPLYIVGNKIDLLPQDSAGYLRRTKEHLREACLTAGVGYRSTIQHVALVSAKTGYGIEDLVDVLLAKWGKQGSVYIIGSANSGKSTLFNALLSSDYCKSSARDFIQRATICQWPGTTINLLKFPVIKPAPWRLYQRRERLQRERSEWEEVDRMRRRDAVDTGRLSYAHLVGHISQTFHTIDSVRIPMDDVEDDMAMYSYHGEVRETGRQRSEVTEPDLDESIYESSRWCYDTPGLLHDQQIIHQLTQDELSVMLANKLILPRTFILHPKQTMFVSGLARIDYLEGPKNVWLTAVTCNKLPIHVMATAAASQFYTDNIGTAILGVPLGDDDRLAKLAPLDGPEVKVTGQGQRQSGADLLLSSVGWVAVTTDTGHSATFKLRTPGGCGAHFRRPALLPYLVQHKGKRIRDSPAYNTTKPLLGRPKKLQTPPGREAPDHIKYAYNE